MTDINTLLEETVTECTLSLFKKAKVDLTRTDSSELPADIIGIIGFTGETIRGVLGLAVSPELAARAAEEAAAGRTTVEDWLGESSNQLLGRVKNRLLAWSVEISVALPIVLRGLQLRLLPQSREPVRAYGFRSDEHNVVVWIDVQTTNEFALVQAEESQEEAPSEGDMMLF